MADRFFALDLPHSGPITLTGDEARHLARVARREVGDLVEVFDGRGRCVTARVDSIDRERVLLSPADVIREQQSSVELSLFVATPKGDRFDWLVEKATELGVWRLIPLKTERSVVDPRVAKIERLRRLVIEASKQCGRNRLMEIDEANAATNVFERSTSAFRLFADSGGLPAPLWPDIPPGSSVSLAVGPEGGWTDAERRSAADHGWTVVGLGPNRLRVETAAVAGSAIVFSRISEGRS